MNKTSIATHNLELENNARSTQSQVSYLTPDSLINRRFVAPGEEINTGAYEPHKITVRDGRDIRDKLTLDTHGFSLIDAPTKINDFHDSKQVDEIYPNESLELVKELTGASCGVGLGWMLRTSGDIPKVEKSEDEEYSHQGGMSIQPPAGEVHVDFTPELAPIAAEKIYAENFPDGKPYSRFIVTSFWRAFSPPPQDWPLAVCDSSSVGDEEGVPNTMHIVNELPDHDAMFSDEIEKTAIAAASIFHYNPNHRWWYYSNMLKDVALLFKFYDSEEGVAKRTLHTAFHDTSFGEKANARESIEFRSFVFFVDE